MNISTILTPPRDRLAVQTYVVHRHDAVITDAIRYELERNGQVFFVHNDIETLPTVAAKVKKLVPDARIATVHGRMPPRRIEDVLMAFIAGDTDVLITTTIIENGVDIPNVNTLIVNNAHHFGLAQLYQLRGRVGRATKRAYAYLLVPASTTVSTTALRRLAALEDFSQLGSGFRLAALDLELRGAGQLLGKRQHGHIAALGLDTYLGIIAEEVARRRNQPPPRTTTPEIQLPLPVQIPPAYMPQERHRIYYYRELHRADSESRLRELAAELSDLYGPPPKTVVNLITLHRLRLRAAELGVAKISSRSPTQLILQIDVDREDCLDRWIRFLAHNRTASFREPDTIIIRVAQPVVGEQLPQAIRDLLAGVA